MLVLSWHCLCRYTHTTDTQRQDCTRYLLLVAIIKVMESVGGEKLERQLGELSSTPYLLLFSYFILFFLQVFVALVAFIDRLDRQESMAERVGKTSSKYGPYFGFDNDLLMVNKRNSVYFIYALTCKSKLSPLFCVQPLLSEKNIKA